MSIQAIRWPVGQTMGHPLGTLAFYGQLGWWLVARWKSYRFLSYRSLIRLEEGRRRPRTLFRQFYLTKADVQSVNSSWQPASTKSTPSAKAGNWRRAKKA